VSRKSKKRAIVESLHLLAAFTLPPAVTILATMANREWMPGRFDSVTAEIIPLIAALFIGCALIRAAIADEGWPMTIGAWALYVSLMALVTPLVGLAFVGWRYNAYL
jgi:hypothetical protein